MNRQATVVTSSNLQAMDGSDRLGNTSRSSSSKSSWIHSPKKKIASLSPKKAIAGLSLKAKTALIWWFRSLLVTKANIIAIPCMLVS